MPKCVARYQPCMSHLQSRIPLNCPCKHIINATLFQRDRSRLMETFGETHICELFPRLPLSGNGRSYPRCAFRQVFRFLVSDRTGKALCLWTFPHQISFSFLLLPPPFPLLSFSFSCSSLPSYRLPPPISFQILLLLLLGRLLCLWWIGLMHVTTHWCFISRCCRRLESCIAGPAGQLAWLHWIGGRWKAGPRKLHQKQCHHTTAPPPFSFVSFLSYLIYFGVYIFCFGVQLQGFSWFK